MKKNILLTGALGFIGQHLLKTLKEKDSEYEVIALSSKLIPSTKTVLHKNYSFDKDDFLSIGIDRIDILIHAGAFTPKSKADSNNIACSNSNIVNTEYLLNNLPSPVQRIIYLSTLDVYKPSEFISEESELAPVSLYGYSKLYCERMIQAWGSLNNSIVQILRIGHIYGYGEEAYSKIIPATIRTCLNGKPPVIISGGEEKRTFLYITDCVSAIIKAIELRNDNIINIVSDEALSVRDIVTTIRDYIDLSLPIIIKKEISGYSLGFDTSGMKRLHNPEVPFLQGIKEEIESYKKDYNA